MIKTIAVCGAGTMGSGIAQVAAQAGYSTILFDLDPAVSERSKLAIRKSLTILVSKNKITEDQQEGILAKIKFITAINECVADLVIEAIIEKAEIKISLFNQLSNINTSDCIFASNTSSLSITDLQQAVKDPARVAGLHFFNPAPVMKLVEVVRGKFTNDETIDTLIEVCKRMNKTSVVCKDSPGFIVNRVARHYYLEAMKLVELKLASFEDVDSIMEASGFKLGPFKLMDLIGMDINYAVSESIYAAFDHAERFKPSAIQQEKVESRELGIKTGKGFYQY